MGHFANRFTLASLITISLFSCNRHKIKVWSGAYANGKPKIIFFFDNEDDASQNPVVQVSNGIGHANKPISFDEERYYDNGRLQSRGRFTKGQTCGLWEYFYDTGIPQARCYYQNGIGRDTVYCWYPTGKLKRTLIETDTVKGYWHGVDYFENGHKSIESNLSKDSLDKWTVSGKWDEWHENGQEKFQANVKNNWTVGKWQEWDSNGILKEVSQRPLSINY